MSNDKPITSSPNPPLVLRAFYLFRNESYAPGVPGYPSAESYWDHERHPKLRAEEQKNGDVWLIRPNGVRIEISALAICNRVRGPETLKQSEAVRRG